MTDHPTPGRAICTICGADVPHYYAGSSGACFDCRLAAHIPPWYAAAERYAYDPAVGHANATRRPSTGMDWLDQSPTRICDALAMCPRKPKGR
ncbi:MAG: hypothetical protein GX591_11775 [Planctomycetes bacterium]|nr:hypothetical protein [Planctomycetota bacterium]